MKSVFWVLSLTALAVSSCAEAPRSARFYDLLAVPGNATQREIRRAFIKVAKRYIKKMDHAPKDWKDAILREANEAAIAGSILMVQERRLIYDAYGENGFCWNTFWECGVVDLD
ncbi:hypothetical protein BJ741DRAFT_582888 [Chytriomyces cf. hyalinus JEL632]|nr:hypothetical protein BJ741DRAFT_582888 [Chytriomyces cf. hyalinus JEL632]